MMLCWSPLTGAKIGSSPSAMLNYLLSPVVQKDFGLGRVDVMRSPAPELLRGSPALMADLLDSLTSKHRYSVATLSFAATDIDVDAFNRRDIQSRTKVDQLIELFYQTAFPGIPEMQRPALLVGTHTHVGRLEVNIVVPRYVVKMDGQIRSYSPLVPRQSNRALWNAFQDLANTQLKMADPWDPRLHRSIRFPDRQYKHFLQAQRQNQKIPLNDAIAIGIAAAMLDREEPAPAGREDLISRLAPVMQKRGVVVLEYGDSGVTFKSGGREHEPHPSAIWTLRGDRMSSDRRRREMRAKRVERMRDGSLPTVRLRYRLCAAKWAQTNARRYGFPVARSRATEALMAALSKALHGTQERQLAWCLAERIFSPATSILQNIRGEVDHEGRFVNASQQHSEYRASRHAAGQTGGVYGTPRAASDCSGSTGGSGAFSGDYGVSDRIPADSNAHRRDRRGYWGGGTNGRGTCPTETSCPADKRESAGPRRGDGAVGKDARSPIGRSRISLFARLIAEARRYNIPIAELHGVTQSDGRFAVGFKLDGKSYVYTGGNLRDQVASGPAPEPSPS